MGKKFTTLISTLALAASSLAATIPPPVFATGESEISLDNYWSFSEILELKNNLDAEARENCGEDYECKVEYRKQQTRNRYQEDPRYLLIGQITGSNFQVTGINPTAETVTIYCNDENMEDGEFTREESHYRLKDVYLAWAEEGYPDMRNSQVLFNDGTKNRYGPVYVADANNGTTTEKVHQVFAHKSSDGDPASSWLEYGKENVLNVVGSNLVNNTSRMLHFAAYAYEGYSVVGAVPYGNFATNYQPGMEYKLMYDKNNLYEYWVPQYIGGQVPAEESAEPTNASTTSAEPEKTAFTISVNRISTSGLGVLTTSNTASNTASNSTFDAVSNTTTNFTSDDTSKCPCAEEKGDDTIEVPLSGDKEEHIFPWWIIVFIFSGIFLTLWWFIPVKKYEKSIDK